MFNPQHSQVFILGRNGSANAWGAFTRRSRLEQWLALIIGLLFFIPLVALVVSLALVLGVGLTVLALIGFAIQRLRGLFSGQRIMQPVDQRENVRVRRVGQSTDRS